MASQAARFKGVPALPFGAKTPDLLLRCDGGLQKADPLDSEGRGSWAFVALHPVTQEVIHRDYGVISRTTVNGTETLESATNHEILKSSIPPAKTTTKYYEGFKKTHTEPSALGYDVCAGCGDRMVIIELGQTRHPACR